jgi:hypothetical protein
MRMASYGDGYGYGYGEDEIEGPIIEQTSSSPSHYELMALANELSQIKQLILQSHQASEALRDEAQIVLQAHAQSAQEYIHQVDQPESPDFFPFISMPAGNTVRDLPEGGRIFSLPDGRELTLHPSMLTATHEAAGVEGLPIDIDPVLVAEGRYRIDLPDALRLDVNHKAHLVTICNPAGIIDILGIDRIEGVGEKVTVRLLPGGAKGFTCAESGHGGLIESDGTIHLSLEGGQDLIIRFPDPPNQFGDGAIDDDEPCTLECERRES